MTVPLTSSPGAAVHTATGGASAKKHIFPQFWRPEVQGHGEGRSASPFSLCPHSTSGVSVSTFALLTGHLSEGIRVPSNGLVLAQHLLKGAVSTGSPSGEAPASTFDLGGAGGTVQPRTPTVRL